MIRMMSMGMMIMDGCEKIERNKEKIACSFQPTTAKFAERHNPCSPFNKLSIFPRQGVAGTTPDQASMHLTFQQILWKLVSWRIGYYQVSRLDGKWKGMVPQAWYQFLEDGRLPSTVASQRGDGWDPLPVQKLRESYLQLRISNEKKILLHCS